MSPTSYQTAPSRINVQKLYTKMNKFSIKLLIFAWLKLHLSQILVVGAWFEPTTFAKLSRVEPDRQATNQNWHDQTIKMVAGAGFEPTTFGLWARRATRLLHPASTDLLLNTNLCFLDYKLVRKGGLEPPRPKALPPQGSVSTNSTTTAAVTHSSRIMRKKKVLNKIIQRF